MRTAQLAGQSGMRVDLGGREVGHGVIAPPGIDIAAQDHTGGDEGPQRNEDWPSGPSAGAGDGDRERGGDRGGAPQSAGRLPGAPQPIGPRDARANDVTGGVHARHCIEITTAAGGLLPRERPRLPD
jgi:hypothetical protein